MAKRENRRINFKILQADIEAYQALQDITDYAPANAAYSLTSIAASFDGMQTSQTEETQALVTASEKRDAATAKEWKFHNDILGVKSQIGAQYGDDSPQVQAVGLKRKSDYKNPTKKKERTG